MGLAIAQLARCSRALVRRVDSRVAALEGQVTAQHTEMTGRPCPCDARRQWVLRRLSASVRAWVCQHCFPPPAAVPPA